MKNNAIVAGLVGLLIGSMLTYAVVSNKPAEPKKQTTETHMMPNGQMMGDNVEKMDNSMSMQAMVEGLKGKTGDEFDKVFLSEMIEHHQGAIDMAKLVMQNAKHEEVKKLADDIISAQTSEITQMKQWQMDWGYNK